MINHTEAKIEAWLAIADLVGLDYFRSHLEKACQAYTPAEDDSDIYEYFLGFEGEEHTNKWTVFAKVTVNLSTKKVTFLDYRTPDGKRMVNPLRPISFT